MIGSWALTCCACCAPSSTSCCCEIPHPAANTTVAVIAAPAKNRLIVGLLFAWIELAVAKGKTYSPMAPFSKLLTLARDRRRRKSRERHGLFVTEGVRAVEELLRSP